MGHAEAILWMAVAATALLTAAFAGLAPSTPTGRPAVPLAAVPLAIPPPAIPQPPSPETAAMAFGVDATSAAEATRLGMRPDYGSLWIGAWTLRWGWDEPDRQLRSLRAANITPAVHFYYWGDDLSPACLSDGCADKTQGGWDRLAQELTTHLRSTLAGAPAWVLLETEFNKAEVARYAPLDALLAAKATLLRGVPGVQVVLALGNWNPDAWPTWSLAAAASDYTGLQAMFGSTRDSMQALGTIVNRTLAGARQLRADFGKPVVLHDVAFSSYPEPDDLAPQAAAVRQLMACLAPLKAAGVQAILYRGLHDNPGMDPANHYGQAERHFGLAWEDHLKPAGTAWLAGMRQERASATAPGTAPGCQ